MGQERFADVVDRFTNGFAAAAAAASPETVKQWQEELDRNVRRMTQPGPDVHGRRAPHGPDAARGDLQAQQVAAVPVRVQAARHRTPLLFVPNLGISRPYIFDLLPGGSFIEHMTREGFDFYLLDWGVFGPEDNGLTFEDCVVKILPRMARKVLESSGRLARCPCSATAWARRCPRASWPRIPRSP